MNENTTTIQSDDIPEGAVRFCPISDRHIRVRQCLSCEHFAGVRAVGTKEDHARRKAMNQPFWRMYLVGCKFPVFSEIMEIKL